MQAIVKICLFLSILLHSLQLKDEPVPAWEPPPIDKPSAKCLANALWFEARGESLEGQKAVFEVIKHRELRLKKSTCKVLSQPQQFPWYKGQWKTPNEDMKLMLDVAQWGNKVLNDENYLWFYSRTVLDKPPHWAAKMKCTPVGNHMFCKEKK